MRETGKGAPGCRARQDKLQQTCAVKSGLVIDSSLQWVGRPVRLDRVSAEVFWDFYIYNSTTALSWAVKYMMKKVVMITMKRGISRRKKV